MASLRYLFVWIRIYLHTKMTMKTVRRIYSGMCALDYDFPFATTMPEGKLLAYGSTIHFVDKTGHGFSVNESINFGLIAQEFHQSESGEIKGFHVFRERTLKEGRKKHMPFLRSLAWLDGLINVHHYLMAHGIYKRREIENMA